MSDSKKFTPIGLLGTNEKGEYVFVPIETITHAVVNPARIEGAGLEEAGIAEALGSDEEKIEKERSIDYSLEGRLKRAPVSEEELSE